MNQQDMLDAIYDDDRRRVADLLRTDSRLAVFTVQKPKLYEGKISHWIYAGDTALHLASAGYRVEIVELLLAAGAGPNSASNHRQSGPLHYAADAGPGRPAWDPQSQVATIRRLLEAGAKINAPDKNGATPLHRAVRTRGAEAVRCLLEAGSDPLLANKPGSTPFHLAVQNTGRGGSGSSAAIAAQREIIKQFLLRGITADLTDAKGKSVMDCARSDWIRDMLRTKLP